MPVIDVSVRPATGRSRVQRLETWQGDAVPASSGATRAAPRRPSPPSQRVKQATLLARIEAQSPPRSRGASPKRPSRPTAAGRDDSPQRSQSPPSRARPRGERSPSPLRQRYTAALRHGREALDAAAERSAARRAAAEANHDNYKTQHVRALQERAHAWRVTALSALFVGALRCTLQDQRAMKHFVRVVPMIRRIRAVAAAKARAAAYSATQLPGNPRPTPGFLRTQVAGAFFKQWSDGEAQLLCDAMEPVSLRKGEFIILQGDYDRVMYFLVSGAAKLLFMPKGGHCKARSEANSTAVIPVPAPAYFGEFAVMCMEPRSASVLCAEDCNLWRVPLAPFERVTALVSFELRSSLGALTNQRRQDNMARFRAPRLGFLSRVEFLRQWDAPMVAALLAALTPRVVNEGGHVYEEGDVDAKMYFVAAGEVAVSRTSTPTCSRAPYTVTAGGTLGEFEALFTGDHRPESALAVTRTDLWCLTRDKFYEVAMDNARKLIAARDCVLTLDMARFIAPPADAFVRAPMVRYALTRAQAMAAWRGAAPRVYFPNDVLWREKEAADSIVLISSGAVALQYSQAQYAGQSSTISTATWSGQSTVPFATAAVRTRGRRKSAVVMLQSTKTPGCVAHAFDGYIMVGLYEFAQQAAYALCSVRAKTVCQAYVIDRRALEETLGNRRLRVLIAAAPELRAAFVDDDVPAARIHDILYEGAPPGVVGQPHAEVRSPRSRQ
jgi:CRP-like cAMP-binding protein